MHVQLEIHMPVQVCRAEKGHLDSCSCPFVAQFPTEHETVLQQARPGDPSASTQDVGSCESAPGFLLWFWSPNSGLEVSEESFLPHWALSFWRSTRTWLLLSPLPSWQRDSPLLPLHLEVIAGYSLTPPSPPITASLSFQSSCPCYFKCLLRSGPNPYNNFSKRKDVQKEENKTHRTTLNSKAIRNYPLSIWVAINSRSRNYPRRPLRHLLDHSIFLSYQTFHKEKKFSVTEDSLLFFFL